VNRIGEALSEQTGGGGQRGQRAEAIETREISA
jgi:hypothetical protein